MDLTTSYLGLKLRTLEALKAARPDTNPQIPVRI
jgi:hypothetical protein